LLLREGISAVAAFFGVGSVKSSSKLNTKSKALSLFPWIGILLCLSVAGCSKGLDLKPDFSSHELYKVKINKDLKEIGDAKKEAFNWAVDDISIDDLGKNHKDHSYLQIAKIEIDKKVDLSKKELPDGRAKILSVLEELKKVQVEAFNPRIVGDFFGAQFKFDTKISNLSSYDFSKLVWIASLYLNGSDTAVAKASVVTHYESSGGLRTNQVGTETIKVGSFNPPEGWVNLAAQNAKELKVVLELDNAFDFSNKSYIETQLLERVNYLAEVPAIAEKYKVALEKKDEPTPATQSVTSTTKQVNRTTCNNQCTNGNCVRTFPDGTQENWQAPRKYDALSQNWGWDTSTNACGL
jgi:hypothetical protein